MQVNAKIMFVMDEQTTVYWFCNGVEVELPPDDDRHINTVQQLVELVCSKPPQAVSAMIVD